MCEFSKENSISEQFTKKKQIQKIFILIKFKIEFNIEILDEYEFIFNNITSILHNNIHTPEIIYQKSHWRNLIIENTPKELFDRKQIEDDIW